MKDLKYGNITIDFPDETIRTFSIFENLVELFGVEVQSEAVQLLKAKIKEYPDVIKPKPDIDFDSDYTNINSRSADTILAIADIINALTKKEYRITIPSAERDAALQEMKSWKQPRAQKWIVGDVFLITLADKTYMFGQVIDIYFCTSPTCSLFELNKKIAAVTIDELIESRVLAVQNTDGCLLANFTFKVLFNCELLVDASKAKKGESTADDILQNLANAYYGHEPWNVLGDEDYYDRELINGIKRPSTALILNKEDRLSYRRRVFKLDENDNRI